jgi:hypothetical protein
VPWVTASRELNHAVKESDAGIRFVDLPQVPGFLIKPPAMPVLGDHHEQSGSKRRRGSKEGNLVHHMRTQVWQGDHWVMLMSENYPLERWSRDSTP